MIWLVYERETGVVVGSITADNRPTVMDHHNTFEYEGDALPNFNAIRISGDGSSIETAPDALEIMRAIALQSVNRKRDTVQQSGCQTALGLMESDTESRLLLSGAIQMAQIAMSAGQPFLMGWTMANNETVEHDAMQLITAGVAMGQHIARAHSVAVGLKTAIKNAETVEAIRAIDIEAAPWVA